MVENEHKAFKRTTLIRETNCVMGYNYSLKIEDFDSSNNYNQDPEIVTVFDEDRADQICKLAIEAQAEIEARISRLSKEKLMEDDPQRAKDTFFSVVEREKIIGYGLGYESNKDSDVFYIEVVYVSPKYQRQGIGFSILCLMIDHIKKNLTAYKIIECETQENNIESIRLLEKVGFERKKPNN